MENIYDNKRGVKNYLGFTLIETIVVLALMAILLSIVIPSTNIIANARENDELNRLRRDILDIRTSAIVENKVYSIIFDAENNTYIIIKRGGSESDIETVKKVQFKNGIMIPTSDSSNSIDFKSSGAPNIGKTIELLNRKRQKIKITIAPATGSVNITIDKKSKS